MSSISSVGPWPSNCDFAIHDGDVARALAAFEAFEGVVPDDLLPHFQIAIDKKLVWRSELLTKVALRLIVTTDARERAVATASTQSRASA